MLVFNHCDRLELESHYNRNKSKREPFSIIIHIRQADIYFVISFLNNYSLDPQEIN